MINVYGYVRVSTRSQNYETQVENLKNFCKLKDYNLVKIFEDKASGKDTDRPGFHELQEVMIKNPMDVSVIITTKLDRVGRSIRDLLKFIDWCNEKSIGFIATLSNIDSTTKEGRLFLYIMGALSEYERELIQERTETGRRRYVANGGKLGRKRLKIPADEIRRLKTEGVPITTIAERFNICRDTVYRRLDEV
jgi:DNA invertase Pin-like site-specific DNA recombinase